MFGMAEGGKHSEVYTWSVLLAYVFFPTGDSEAYVSLATNNQYAYGAITLGRSLRDSGTQRRLALMITEQVTEEMRFKKHKIVCFC